MSLHQPFQSTIYKYFHTIYLTFNDIHLTLHEKKTEKLYIARKEQLELRIHLFREHWICNA